MTSVADLAISLEDYTHVSPQDTLADALDALVRAMVGSVARPSRPRDRGILVKASDGQIIGKLSIWDLLSGLTPTFEPPLDPYGAVDDRVLWSHWLRPEIAARAREIKVRDLMRKSPKFETIDERAPLDLAVHRLIRGRHLSLLVTRGDQIVGILRLSDVVTTVNAMVNSTTPQRVSA